VPLQSVSLYSQHIPIENILGRWEGFTRNTGNIPSTQKVTVGDFAVDSGNGDFVARSVKCHRKWPPEKRAIKYKVTSLNQAGLPPCFFSTINLQNR
jgi:hypothetical protein